MDHEKFDSDKIDEVMLPGFRFHPTDEELVGFYLKRKAQQRPLPIELIKQLDIYKYDPWDLPQFAAIGEKEWYFYCPRDRKYRNSARPNRVTGAGFWKATGTDRPIYSSEGTKCIGLKKSLVFYRGRAAKGTKTDWMMHEFRLPSLSNSSTPAKQPLDKNQPPNDSWAICRIFKKTNSIMQKALSHSNWVSSLPETIGSDHNIPTNYAKFSSSADNISCVTTQAGSAFQFCNISNDLHQSSSTSNFFALDTAALSYKSNNPIPNHPAGFMFSSLDMLGPNDKCPEDVASMILNLSPSIPGDSTTSKINQSIDHNIAGMQEQYSINGSSTTLPQELQQGISLGMGEETCLQKNQQIPNNVNNQLQELGSSSFECPFALAYNNLTDHETWKNSFSWDSPLSCPSELSSTCYSTNKSYT